MTFLIRAAAVALLAACTLAPAAQASVLIGGTRVILPAKEGEVTLRLTNENDAPALVQAWIDTGDAKSTPDNVDTPFLITPPMFRMEARRDQNLRILYTREPLPADRESLFWLNVLDVPPKPADRGPDNSNYLQLAVRSRLKLFFRPEGLQGDPLKAPAELAFHANGGALVVNNPTAFHVTLTDIVLTVGGKSVTVEGGMVAPKSELRLPMTGAASAGTPVSFNAINDFGSPTAFTGTIAP